MKEKEEKEAQLEEKMDRWVYLNDLAEQIDAWQQEKARAAVVQKYIFTDDDYRKLRTAGNRC